MKLFRQFSAVLALFLALTIPLNAADTREPVSKPGDRQGVVKVGDEIQFRLSSPASPASLSAMGQAAKPVSVWKQEIHYPSATYIAPHFEHFNLPPKAYLELRSPDGSRSWRYSGRGKEGLAEGEDGFWGIPIPGDRAIVELVSTRPVAAGAVKVDTIAAGFARYDLGASTQDVESLCGADDSGWARCYETSNPTAYGRSRAVARLLINGTSACTGWLIGDEGHLITNEHCIGSSSDALNTSYEFMAEGSTCATSCASWFGCPGTIVATSATLVQLDVSMDYALVRLPTNPTSTYGFLQFRNSSAVVNEVIYIPQHPQAWGKKIAINSTHSTDGSGRCEIYSLSQPACAAGGPSDVGYYCDTQGGSSGSPVIASSDNLVVALHHCANCPNRGVPIPSIISDLGANLPRNALASTSPATGSLLWLRADAGITLTAGKVSSWADQSGNGRHATMATASRQPVLVTGALNAKPVVRFSGAQSLSLASPVSPTSFTIFIVGKNSNPAESLSMILGPGGNYPNNQMRWENGTQALFVGTGNNLPTTTSTIGNTRIYHELSVRYDGSVMRVYRNGILISSHSFTTSGPWTLAQVAAYYSSSFMIGDLAEVLVYGTALSDADRGRTDSYLKTKYAL